MNKRETQLDILRLIAMLAVIFTHASSIAINSIPAKYLMTFLSATVTWHVPVFVMISGRFFLDPTRNVTAKKLRHAIGRLIIAFLFWNIFYQLYYILTGSYSNLNLRGILSQTVLGPYHFWYLFMLVCLYAVTPFLRKIAEGRKLTEYFIILFLSFEFLTLYGPRLPFIGATITQVLESTQFHFALGYCGYYLLGYYLSCYPLPRRARHTLYIMGITMFLFTGLATVWNAQQGAVGNEWFCKYLMPNVAIEAAALYTFFSGRTFCIAPGSAAARWISSLAEYSFGIYLIHALVLELLEMIPWMALTINPVFLVGMKVIITFAVSTAAIALIRKIPYIGKKIT